MSNKIFGVEVEAGKVYSVLEFRAPNATLSQIEYNLRCVGFQEAGNDRLGLSTWTAPGPKTIARNEKARNEATYGE